MLEKHLLPDWLESAEGFSAFANDCIPIYEPGGTLTGECTGDVRGKRFLRLDAEPESTLIGLSATAEGGNIVVDECDTTGELVLGVANRDVAAGGKVGVLATPGLVVPMIAGAAIAAKALVMTDNQGRAITYAAGAGRYIAGVCIQGAANAGDTCVVRLGGASLGAAA